jgi:activator of HSP90 ATPase
MHSKAQGLTRRGFAGGLVAGLVVGLRAEATGQSMQQIQARAPGDGRTSLHQEVALAAASSRVETALLDAKQFAAFSGLAAAIDAHEGGAFSLFSGMIVGRNVELVAGKRIVQAWRPPDWEPGVYSLVRFEFRANGSGTLVVLDHTGFPPGDFEHLTSGWQEHYWEPLKKFLT